MLNISVILNSVINARIWCRTSTELSRCLIFDIFLLTILELSVVTLSYEAYSYARIPAGTSPTFNCTIPWILYRPAPQR